MGSIDSNGQARRLVEFMGSIDSSEQARRLVEDPATLALMAKAMGMNEKEFNKKILEYSRQTSKPKQQQDKKQNRNPQLSPSPPNKTFGHHGNEHGFPGPGGLGMTREMGGENCKQQ